MNNLGSLIQATHNGLSIPTQTASEKRPHPHSRSAKKILFGNAISAVHLKPAKHSSEAFFQDHVNLIFMLLYSTILSIVSIETLAIYAYPLSFLP
jgi:hypothetical protein